MSAGCIHVILSEVTSTVLKPFLQAYLQSLIDVVETDDRQICIRVCKDVLERPYWLTVTPKSRVRR